MGQSAINQSSSRGIWSTQCLSVSQPSAMTTPDTAARDTPWLGEKTVQSTPPPIPAHQTGINSDGSEAFPPTSCVTTTQISRPEKTATPVRKNSNSVINEGPQQSVFADHTVIRGCSPSA